MSSVDQEKGRVSTALSLGGSTSRIWHSTLTFFYLWHLQAFPCWSARRISIFSHSDRFQALFRMLDKNTGNVVSLRMGTISVPFLLWFSVFTAQPHKEERFMFVAYPALCLNAAIAYHVILAAWGSISSKLTNGKSQEVYKIREFLSWTVLGLPLAATALLSLSRVLAVVSAYSAPLDIYEGLPANATGNLCIAKEWYRFPSSYFLPNGVRAKFLKSAFDGLLPGEFPENTSTWSRPGTWMVPEGMNDENKGDPLKYVCFSAPSRFQSRC